MVVFLLVMGLLFAHWWYIYGPVFARIFAGREIAASDCGSFHLQVDFCLTDNTRKADIHGGWHFSLCETVPYIVNII